MPKFIEGKCKTMGKIVLSADMYKQAAKEEITFSQLLEKLDPTPEDSKLTAFERQLKEHNIVTKSIPEKGISASKVEAFYRTEDSKILFPEFIGTTMRESLIATSILQYLVGLTTTIDGNTYKTIYLEDTTANKKAVQRKRVTEASELPKSKLITADHAINIWKYGNQIEASYEVIRRTKIDKITVHVRRIGQQAAHDEVLDILDIVKDGDGNSNAATVYKNTELDTAASSGTLSQNAFISFLLEFFPNKCNTMVANKAGFLQIMSLLYPAATASQLAALLIGGMALPARVKLPQDLFAEFTVLYEPQVETINAHPAIYGLDQANAIEKVVEAGSDIMEADQFIKNQTKVLTISENAGFCKIDKKASAILEID
jgi:hypothetical protein